MNNMFEMINTIQILYYLPIIDMPFPTMVKLVYSFAGSSNIDIPIPYTQ